MDMVISNLSKQYSERLSGTMVRPGRGGQHRRQEQLVNHPLPSQAFLSRPSQTRHVSIHTSLAPYVSLFPFPCSI